jgi:hypothetical protein
MTQRRRREITDDWRARVERALAERGWSQGRLVEELVRRAARGESPRASKAGVSRVLARGRPDSIHYSALVAPISELLGIALPTVESPSDRVARVAELAAQLDVDQLDAAIALLETLVRRK